MEQQQKPNSQRQASVGETIRQIADQLKQESKLQIKVTSQILGAAAQISENHDRLIDEVVDMVEEDLDNQVRMCQTNKFTVDVLKRQFKTLREAKSHFGVKANSWATLSNKLKISSAQNSIFTDHSNTSAIKRLEAIESEIKIMRTEVSQVLFLLKQLTINSLNN